MCTTPSAPPESARCTAAVSEPLRPVRTRRSIGSEAPDTPSMRPSWSRRETTLPGVAPKMSVSTSTPSPASSASISSRARSTRSSMSSARQTLSVATCCCAPPRIWLALVSSDVPMSPWVTMRTPIMDVEDPSLQLSLEGFEEHAGDVEAGLVLDFAEAGGAGDVHLGQPVADDIEAHDQETPCGQPGADFLCNFPLPRAERLRDATRAGGEIAARVAALGDAGEAVRHHRAVDQDHALVSLGDLGNEALRHDGAPAALRNGLDDDIAVRIIGAHAEHVLAAHHVEPFHDDVALLVDERLEALGLARYQRRRGEARELGDGELLVVVADRVGSVEHAGALAHRRRQQPGADDVLEVERRILAHQRGAEAGKRPRLGFVRAVPVLVVIGKRDAHCRGGDAALLPVQAILLAHPDGVAALLRG